MRDFGPEILVGSADQGFAKIMHGVLYPRFEPVWAQNAEIFFERLHEGYYASIVERGPSFERIGFISSEVRKRYDIPIVAYLDEVVSNEDIAKCYELGVTHCLLKPVSIPIVASILQSYTHLRPSGYRDLVVGPLVFDDNLRRFSWHGRRLDLTLTESKLLYQFMLRPQRVFNRDSLQRIMRNETSEEVVEKHISNLRKKFDVQIIATVRGEGYRLAL
jgi:DNA-binding response OmpR family regulator